MTQAPHQDLHLMLLEDNEAVAGQLMGELQAWDRAGTVHHCRTIAEGLEHVAAGPLDIMIADLHLPDGSGVDVIRAARLHRPEAIIIVTSALNEGPVVLNAIRAGAAGYVDKADSTIDVLSAIEQAMSGKAPMSGTIARLIIQSLHDPPPEPDLPRVELTQRETEVLNAVARGFSNREVADIFGISPQTVPVHTRNIYRKLEVSSKTEAVFIARQHGLIP